MRWFGRLLAAWFFTTLVLGATIATLIEFRVDGYLSRLPSLSWWATQRFIPAESQQLGNSRLGLALLFGDIALYGLFLATVGVAVVSLKGKQHRGQNTS